MERGGIVPDAVVLELYQKMLTVFYVEERLKIFDRLGKVSFHASARGHEKLQIGMTLLLKPRQDWFVTYYREKGIAIGLGMSLKNIFLGMLSRQSDPNSAGRNMPEHWSSRELRLVAQTAATGTQFLPAVGLARAVKRDGGGEIVYVSSGEGATSEGEFFEALNWTSRERLPVLFVIQNNGYAIGVPQQVQTSSEIHRIAQGFGMPTYTVDGTWFEPMYQMLPPVIEMMRQGGGPALVEGQVIRMDSHSSSDDQKKYRSQEELNEMIERDPIHQTERYLQRHRILDEEQMQQMRDQTKAAVDRAADEADQEPAPRTEGILAHIYADNSDVAFSLNAPAKYVSEEPISLIEAINHGLREEMELNPKIIMWGEDIADPKGGVFGVTRGLSTLYPDRVANSPLAEASIVGVAGGMAIAGYKPIVEIQFADYMWPAFMQIRNEVPTVRWRSQGVWTCPVVIRIPVGGHIKGGPWHSACVEAFLAHIPGWHVVFPSSAEDAKGLIKSAARSSDPVIFFEHKALYRRMESRTQEPNSDYLIPFGRGRIRRDGRDGTIVTWGASVYQALEIAKRKESECRLLEVLDIRSIIPLDERGANLRKRQEDESGSYPP
ncbi:MAG TPA: thiamine pyrophosphate-dependent enzyme [Candidatus Acidoferrales bacterium]|nr:thiamine pyrophosphate-dependent enzyme [Candidatus Acidoferrales bacterium]